MGIFKRRGKPTEMRSLEELQPMLESGQPVLLDFYQFGCGPCKIMDGIVNELADEYEGTAHVVKVNVARVPGAVQTFAIRSTPTFVVLGRSGKAAEKGTGKGRITPRWRGSGLVRKDQLIRVLEGNGATRKAPEPAR